MITPLHRILVAGGVLGVDLSFVGMARWGARTIAGMVMSRFGGRKLAFFVTKRSAEDLALLADLIEAGKVTPVIDRRYSLDETAAAIRHVQAGHAHGKVVIVMEPER